MTDKVLCRYFALNACKKGDACPFSHNLKDQPSNVCTFYLRGNCSYGTNCRYEHVSARKLAETRGWGPLAGKPAVGAHSAPESSPPSVLISAHSPTGMNLGGTQVESPIPTRPVSADQGGVNRDGVDANGGKSWAAMAAKAQKENERDASKLGGKGESVPKGPVSGERSATKGVQNGHAEGQQGPNSGEGIQRSTSGAAFDASGSSSRGGSSHTAAEPPLATSDPVTSSESNPSQHGDATSSDTAQASEQTGNARDPSGEEFDVQRGAWRPPHLQEAPEEGKVSPGIPHSISPGLNSAARAFSPSAVYQDPNGGQYMPAAGYPPHMGGAVMVPPYGLTDENGIPYEDNGLPDELWDWVDQMTISDQDEYAAMNGYEMQGIAYVPGQPYPQSFSPSPPIAYVPGQMYPHTYSPAPYQQYPQPYPDVANPYLQTPQVYHGNPFPAPQNPPETNSEHPQNSEAAETPETSGLVRSNSLDDFPHLASPNPNPSQTENANPDLSPKDQPICPFAAAGDCPREKDGGSCGQLHGEKCPSCGKRCLHPHRPEERKEHLEMCEKRVKKLKQLQKSQEVECCVCLERVLTKPRVAERKFGILSGCDHAFCIGCIRGWRSGDHTTPGMDLNAIVRSCPVCRQQSYFVTPSVVWYSSPEEKDQILEGYKRKLKGIDCRHFNFGDGSCPFGTSCFYRHRFRDGREEEVTLRHLGTADGTVTIAKSVRLSDFIDLSALKKRR